MTDKTHTERPNIVPTVPVPTPATLFLPGFTFADVVDVAGCGLWVGCGATLTGFRCAAWLSQKSGRGRWAAG